MSALRVEHLSAEYATSTGVVRAVHDVSFEVERGEILGLIGESGCGKSTIGKALLNNLEPPGRIAEGKVWVGDTDLLSLSGSALRRVRWDRIAMVPQSAMHSLNPVYRVGEQIAEALLLHTRCSQKAAQDRAKQLLKMVGVEPGRARDYPHQFSGGMRQRVAIAMALSCEPEVLICDEATTGLDVLTEAQVIGVLHDMRRELGLSILMISHDLQMIGRVCDRIAIMYAGRLAEVAPSEDVLADPRHPYTRGLLSAVPVLTTEPQHLEPIPGVVPDLRNLPPGCRFAPRCAFAVDSSSADLPELVESTASQGDQHRLVACIRDGELDEVIHP
jgi:peptide/nickel transport system ATP-binding protein